MNEMMITGEQPVTMTSREISELTGKEHFHVMRDSEAMLKELGKDPEGYIQFWIHPQNGQEYRQFVLPAREVKILVTGYSIVLRAKVIDRLEELEARAAKQPDLSTDEGRLLMIQELATKQLALVVRNKSLTRERDHAVATKAEIGSRREATAMAKASAAVREANRLRGELGRNSRHATVIAVEKAIGTKFAKNAYVGLRAWGKSNGVGPVDVVDERYGSVKAWPAGAWLSAYGIDLSALFPDPMAVAA